MDTKRGRKPTTPEEILREVMEELEMSREDMAGRLNWDVADLELVLDGALKVTESRAVDLERVINASASFWLNLQGLVDSWEKVLDDLRPRDFPDTLEGVDAEVERLLEEVERLREHRVKIGRRWEVECGRCGHFDRVDTLRLRSVYYYERPWGCMGGDTWHFTGVETICTSCQRPTRYVKTSSECEWLQGLRQSFAGVDEVKGDHIRVIR